MPGKIPTGLAVPYEDDTIGVWDVAAAASLLHAPGERWQFVWSSDSTLLALLERRGVGGEVVLWNIAQRERTPLAKFSNRVYQFAWMRDDNLLITAESDDCLRW